jgi:diaminopimelate decarboxylase
MPTHRTEGASPLSADAVPNELNVVLREHLPRLEAGQEVDADLLLVMEGGLDSLGMVGLLAALEDAFDVQIPNERLTEEMFATPTSLWQAIRDLVEPG